MVVCLYVYLKQCITIKHLVLFQDALLDCPVLVDLGHGTVRHRKPDEKSTANSKVKTGYFYHARLEDFSESIFFNF